MPRRLPSFPYQRPRDDNRTRDDHVRLTVRVGANSLAYAHGVAVVSVHIGVVVGGVGCASGIAGDVAGNLGELALQASCLPALVNVQSPGLSRTRTCDDRCLQSTGPRSKVVHSWIDDVDGGAVGQSSLSFGEAWDEHGA